MLPPDQLAEFRRKKAVWEESTSAIRTKIAALLDPGEVFDADPGSGGQLRTP